MYKRQIKNGTDQGRGMYTCRTAWGQQRCNFFEWADESIVHVVRPKTDKQAEVDAKGQFMVLRFCCCLKVTICYITTECDTAHEHTVTDNNSNFCRGKIEYNNNFNECFYFVNSAVLFILQHLSGRLSVAVGGLEVKIWGLQLGWMELNCFILWTEHVKVSSPCLLYTSRCV